MKNRKRRKARRVRRTRKRLPPRKRTVLTPRRKRSRITRQVRSPAIRAAETRPYPKSRKASFYSGFYSQHDVKPDTWKSGEKSFLKGTVGYDYVTYNWRNNVKWIRYKVYRVDPLTRENITTHFGVDEPVVDVCYGASDSALKCRLPLNDLGIEYQAGEMYRVEMSVEEYIDYKGTDVSLDTAKCKSSIVFMCYDTEEYKEN